jgi:hypothetical protein
MLAVDEKAISKSLDALYERYTDAEMRERLGKVYDSEFVALNMPEVREWPRERWIDIKLRLREPVVC